VKSDLFALGSVMYYFMSNHAPYEGLSEKEIYARYTQGEFLDVGNFGCGRTIKGCWSGEFTTAQDVVASLSEEAVVEVSKPLAPSA
jgi:hypothetical protein